jgi:Ser/Thr protein kinase RdoA (MazF antagonist)
VNAAAWTGVEPVERLTGGHRNPVFLARRGDRRLVLRRSGRPAGSLDWELDLLEHLADHGVTVPRLVPADDGRRHVDGWLVQEFFAGERPSDPADWRRVVDVLTEVHSLTAGWPQRPGFASARRLLTTERGGDVRLDAMPAAAAGAVRAAWRPILSGPECAVHGDVGAGNVLVDGDRVALLDWDEARVDVPWLDFAFVPEDVAVPFPGDRQALVTAGVAWEAATCWVAEPEYAARRLTELQARLQGVMIAESDS